MLQNFDESFEEIKKVIENNDNFFILTHVFPDGDSLGSQIALFELLNLLRKNTTMICNSKIPYQYNFLPYLNKIKKQIDYGRINFPDGNFVFICLDSADKSRFDIKLKDIKPAVKKLINIDHHLGNTGYGDINIVDPNKSATAEILYEFIIKEFPGYMNYNIAISLYTAILTDTGRFQYENTTPDVHRIVSHLIEYGITPSDIFSHIYENEPINRFKLLERVLRRIKVIDSKKLVYSYVLQKDFESLDLPFSANDGVIELLRSASVAKIAVLFKQISAEKFKISLRSTDSNYNVAEIARIFGGGGHKMASAYSGKGSLKKLIKDLLNVIDINV